MFSVMSICSRRDSLCNPYPWCQWSVTGHMGTPPFFKLVYSGPINPPQTCSNLYTWDCPQACLNLLTYDISPLPCTSIGNRAVGLRLKSLLAYYRNLQLCWRTEMQHVRDIHKSRIPVFFSSPFGPILTMSTQCQCHITLLEQKLT